MQLNFTKEWFDKIISENELEECGAGILAMNPKAFDESLEFLKAKAETFNCMDVCSYIFDDPRFAICSGSGKPHQHHNGDGGLVIHTAEVVRLCLTINLGDWTVNGPVPIVSCKQLFLAAFFHDVGKMWDYQRVSSGGNSPDDPIVTSWTGTTHRRNIHHISRSALTWQKAVDKADAYPNKTLYSQEFVDEVLHAILSHHGMREWGSPVTPNSKLAWILHLCDGLSARLDDCLKFDHIKE